MGYEASVLYRATKRLEEGRRRREEALARRRREIYAQLPRVLEIDKELKGTVYQIIASSLRDGRDPGPSIQVIKDHNLSLQAERTGCSFKTAGEPTPWTSSPPAPSATTPAGWEPGCATA